MCKVYAKDKNDRTSVRKVQSLFERDSNRKGIPGLKKKKKSLWL